MAQLGYQQSRIGGTALNFVAASAGGDTVPPSDDGMLLVRNSSAGTVTATVVVPGSTKYGQADPDVAVSVAAGATTAIGPFPADLADPTDNQVHVTVAPAASVTVAAVRS